MAALHCPEASLWSSKIGLLPHSWRFMDPNWSITRKNSRNAEMNNSRCSVNWLNSPLADPPTVCPGMSLTLNEIEKVINSERVWGKDGLLNELVGINIGNTTLDTVWTARYSTSGAWAQSQSTSTNSYGKTLLLNVCENCHSQYFFCNVISQRMCANKITLRMVWSASTFSCFKYRFTTKHC